VNVWESGSILLYLAEKYNVLLPDGLRTEVMNWLMWGSTAVSSQFKLLGFYYKYCPHKLTYCVERYAREIRRLLGVLETQLKHGKHWVVGDAFTIADISIWPWVYALHEIYDDCVRIHFNNMEDYPHVQQWYRRCLSRGASQRSLEVCNLGFEK